MYDKLARLGNVFYRFFTLLSLIMTVYFFFLDYHNAGIFQCALYAVWMAVCVYSGIKVISDIIGSQGRRRKNYVVMMEQLAAREGSNPKQAKSTFLLVQLLSAAAKVLVPILLLIL